MNKEFYLEHNFYSPSIQATSVKKLYENVKNRGITMKQVKEFIEKQEAHQLFQKPKSVNYFPIFANHKNEIFQADIMDVSNISGANKNVKYLLTCIDVYSRFAYVIPMTNKESSTVTDAMKNIIDEEKPEIITTDIGSEYISQNFEKLLKTEGIQHVKVPKDDHKRLAIIDRFIRTLRSKIEKYLVMYNTTKYIDVLPKLVESYNTGYHSGIKKIPEEVEDTDKDIDQMLLEKYQKAKQTEIKYEVGQKVRHLLNLNRFEKKTAPRWSKTIHSIIAKNTHSYTLDTGKTFKFYELQPADVVQKLDYERTQPTKEQLRKVITVKRRHTKEGIDVANIVTEKRPRKQTDRF